MNITIPVVASNMSVIPMKKSDGDIWITEVAHCHNTEDAERIAACINFCVGLTTQEIENIGTALNLLNEINDDAHNALTRL